MKDRIGATNAKNYGSKLIVIDIETADNSRIIAPFPRFSVLGSRSWEKAVI
jgi:hypothetical protein